MQTELMYKGLRVPYFLLLLISLSEDTEPIGLIVNFVTHIQCDVLDLCF